MRQKLRLNTNANILEAGLFFQMSIEKKFCNAFEVALSPEKEFYCKYFSKKNTPVQELWSEKEGRHLLEHGCLLGQIRYCTSFLHENPLAHTNLI